MLPAVRQARAMDGARRRTASPQRPDVRVSKTESRCQRMHHIATRRQTGARPLGRRTVDLAASFASQGKQTLPSPAQIGGGLRQGGVGANRQ